MLFRGDEAFRYADGITADASRTYDNGNNTSGATNTADAADADL
jgi:hypothetical protein